MPLHQLRVVPADVSGAGLRLTLNAPAPAPLAACTLPHPDGADLVLGVLGASHVISVTDPARPFSEQVSCTLHATGTALPGSAEAPGYRLRSDTRTHGETAFRGIAADLRHRCEQETGWLGGSFPGDEAALTALWAVPDGPGWHWQTWHLYPDGDNGGGTVVHTESRWRP
ncbi:DUF2617 family protein [Mycolicibacterium diernhoferi]|uniref:DUF2617 domain-containing protein n=1 Tax=Mycolicibacterium diernhoferi TaxID=1801 RepID=A0A1Q4HG23_9MYCO|nr:DUF2617 family protein [Mycolicibacterium diernhoferi]OJZ66476.1 hypothetical protein BRW64_09410 [Mycolicibacterium diernhoferi]OPE55431.1 hypothetical protein BV510_05200 [Mycolicibacterium diernhoferi]PEG56352.1 DUF2617 domain-containing protein [Mycolicibacterium diernhoferi]QYL24652.1 DUF2617 family protein [Mycolicibacterium diernhoferi]